MHARTIIICAVTGLLWTAATAAAQDLSQGGRCSPDTFHRYSVTTPSSLFTTGWPDFQATLHFNDFSATFLMMLFDEDADVVASSVGYTRFAHVRVGLLPTKRYEVWIGCVSAPSDFRLLVTLGDVEEITSHDTGLGFNAREQLAFLDREETMHERLAELAAVQWLE